MFLIFAAKSDNFDLVLTAKKQITCESPLVTEELSEVSICVLSVGVLPGNPYLTIIDDQ